MSAMLCAGPVLADPVEVRDGKFDAVVSADQMSRLSISGDKIVSVRSINEPDGPQMLVEADETTGDVYVAFDGDVLGRTFSLFLVTQSGRTVQAVLQPSAVDGQTVLINLGGTPAQPGASVERSERRVEYLETVTALVRVMFRGETPEGVSCGRGNDGSTRVGPFELRISQTCQALGLRGQVIDLENKSEAAVPVVVDSFLVAGVVAAAADRSELLPGGRGRVFVVEEIR
ncbi:type-F conjugative transfer system secretin TraK [Brevundimonas sp.]|uniref:TraK domain-containing protein n=1 Tax=Brevundimonas sp. TaxID=1871086 RepID=UPI0027F8D2F6|nr:type-F conjugative transfer system secretin TraK [Brevundimonas sp.]MDQ7814112.1 type-F conjugative transfer system secretin TraK [Brevundimonas sp.]